MTARTTSNDSALPKATADERSKPDTRMLSTDLKARFGAICIAAVVWVAALLAADNTLARLHVQSMAAVSALETAREGLTVISLAARNADERGTLEQQQLTVAVNNLRTAAAADIPVRRHLMAFADKAASAKFKTQLAVCARQAEALAFFDVTEHEVVLQNAAHSALLPRLDDVKSVEQRRATLLLRVEMGVRAVGLASFSGILGLIWLLVIRPLASRQQEAMKRMQRNAYAARDLAAQAAEADEAKSEFLSVISHELRTPLNGILGCAELLRVNASTDGDRQLAQTICASGGDLTAIVSQILDFTDLKAGELVLYDGIVDPEQLSEDIETSFGPTAAAAKTRLDVSVVGDPDKFRVGDMTRVSQLLAHLAENAVQFTHGGAVYVTIDNRFARALKLIVRDTGIGMSPPEVARAFDPFTQGDSSATRKTGGAGMGLTMVKKLTDAMAGEVRLESRAGAGSKVTITLPLPFAETDVVNQPLPDEITEHRSGRDERLSAA